MGGITKAVGGLFGGGADEADAARNAADAQLKSTREAIEFQEETRDLAREDLAPFRDAGESALPQLQNLVNNPQAQLDFVQNNPFFDALTKQSTDTLLNNQAARGKVGSGGTAEALQNSLLLLGQDLVNNQINNSFNLANLGQSSAAGQANTALSTGASIADLTTQGGNAQAAGIIGAQNAKTNANNNLINTALGAGAIALSDVRAKENIDYIDTLPNGVAIYSYNYIGEDVPRIGPMAQQVMHVIPEAVIESDGVYYVDYQMIKKGLH
jgi:hypothetical protein